MDCFKCGGPATKEECPECGQLLRSANLSVWEAITLARVVAASRFFKDKPDAVRVALAFLELAGHDLEKTPLTDLS